MHEYERGTLIGVGGFADVYKAVHIRSQRSVALKISREDTESRARIRREVEVQRTLAHAGVMQILDWDRDEYAWFVTEMAEGNLSEINEREPLNEASVVRLLEEVLAALGAAHRRGYVHRDLSPGNILRTHGRWVLADWGYVTDPDASKVGRLTKTGTGGGTFTWAAPEMLVDAHRADARSDLYALGKLAAWLLTAEVPSIGSPPKLPDAAHWRSLIERLTAADPAERFADAEQTLAALKCVVDALPREDVVAPHALTAAEGALAVEAPLKKYLVSSEHRIRLEELVTAVTEETIERVNDARFDANRFDQGDAYIERLQDYVTACGRLMRMLFVGCYYGEPGHAQHWTRCVQRIANTYRQRGGVIKMNEAQRMPGCLAMNAGALGAILAGRYDNLAAVAITPRYHRENQDDLPIVARFGTSTVLARDMLVRTTRFPNRKTPGSELMADYLRDLGRTILVTDDEYEEQFDRYEVIVSLLSIDAGAWAAGRFTWKNERMGANGEHGPIADVRKEYFRDATDWGPLRAGLFGGDQKRVQAAFDRLTQIADAVARG